MFNVVTGCGAKREREGWLRLVAHRLSSGRFHWKGKATGLFIKSAWVALVL